MMSGFGKINIQCSNIEGNIIEMITKAIQEQEQKKNDIIFRIQEKSDNFIFKYENKPNVLFMSLMEYIRLSIALDYDEKTVDEYGMLREYLDMKICKVPDKEPMRVCLLGD